MSDENQLAPEVIEAAKKIKLIVSDLDGTLLRDDKTISDYSIDVIRRIRRAGYVFTACTGRLFSTIQPYIDMLECNDYIIASNGQEVVDIQKGHLLCAPLSNRSVLSFAEFCFSRGIEFTVSTPTEMWHQPGRGPESRHVKYSRGVKQNGKKVYLFHELDGDFSCLANGSFMKMVSLCGDAQLSDEIRAHFDADAEADVVSSDVSFFELVPRGVNKGSGVRALAEHLGLSAENCCVFGDYENDLPMLDYAGLAVVMDNASDAVKAHGDIVAESNECDGEARMLERLFL